MNAPVLIDGATTSLPSLIDRATRALAGARSSAEVLDARDAARLAYDAAKSAARILRAKQAHDTLIAEVHRAQAYALQIEAGAKMRLADEYDAAQGRGEVATVGQRRNVADDNVSTAADLGLRRDEIHEARQLRDAERADPGVMARALDGMLERGEEPTKAALRREVLAPPKEKVSPRALWLWGRLRDFERDGYLVPGAGALLSEMTDPMRAEVRRLAPVVARFLADIGDTA